MRVLVTGGAGFIGSHVVDGLVKAGQSVAVVDDLSTGRRHLLNPSVNFYQVDICSNDVDTVFRTERPEVVVHHAAHILVRASLENPDGDARLNIQGSLNLLEACRRHEVRRFVYASSGGAIYGESRTTPCDEGHPIKPLSHYGASKAAVELYLSVYRHVYGLEYVSLRYGNVYGPRQDPHGEAGVVAIFNNRMLQGDECTVFGSGEQERDFVYVSDVVRANLLALERGGGAYNIGTGNGTSVNTLFGKLASILGYRQQPVYSAAKPGEVFKITLAVRKAEEELDWMPQVSLEEGLRRTVEYFQSVH